MEKGELAYEAKEGRGGGEVDGVGHPNLMLVGES